MQAAADCKNPLLSQTVNPEAAPTSVEAAPKKAAAGQKMCARLAGKDSCCSADSLSQMKSKWNNLKDKFAKTRGEEMGGLKNANSTGKAAYTLDMQKSNI